MHVYDKAKYHEASVEEQGLPTHYSENHTLFFLRWIIERNLISDLFRAILNENPNKSTPDIYRLFGGCFTSEMPSSLGNAFVMDYFENGEYLNEYAALLQKDLPTYWHIPYSEENYEELQPMLDDRYKAWLESAPPLINH